MQLILPIVLYQGKKQWNISTKFMDQFGDFDFDKKFLPDFEYYLIDQTRLNTKDLNGLIASKIMQILLYSSTLGDSGKVQDDILFFMNKLPKTPNLKIRVLFYKYLIETHTKKTVELFTKKMKEYKIPQDNMLTYAQTLIKQRMQQGLLKRTREDILRILKLRFKEIPSLIEKEVINNDNIEQLQDYFEKAILPKSLDELSL